jgi:hypothetical protein
LRETADFNEATQGEGEQSYWPDRQMLPFRQLRAMDNHPASFFEPSLKLDLFRAAIV